jgi:multidrug efflux pump subunit AcrA (membrane-fusion protein)
LKKRKFWPIAISLAVVGTLGALTFFALTSDSDPSYSSVEVKRATLEVSVAANGQLVDELTYGLATGVDPVVTSSALAEGVLPQPVVSAPGYTVKKILVKSGETVTKKQRLIRVENPFGEIEFIKAPSAGIIRTLKAVEGTSASGELITLGVGRLLSLVRVSEYDVADLSIGQSARVNIDALAQEFDAQVIQIGQLADASTGVKRYAVLLEIQQLPANARLGMSTNAKIITESIANALTVPANAILFIDGKNVAVLIDSEQQVTPVEIQIGVVGDTLVEVLSGLSESDQVVVGKLGDIPEVSASFGPPPGVRSQTGGN